ncbi:cytochrome c3 family protein [Mesosutterella sp. OilRF-GAM-744-9]|uniref:Cytochrome c3 family protein n=1 Tax=Mesosutterella porci TaxID=2915351 RepID=A0ABS9MMS5_9BURK|nr:cytochrome c3 family protein [Mesosutterella sp. oilRF-744-WT-GAM-9]MCG5029921.1 cytochrome c3 family protein [Mesosutterella sp. oilRF-744-WT-GAM-9]
MSRFPTVRRLAAAAAVALFLASAPCVQAFAADAPASGKFLADRHVARGMKCDACHVSAQGGKLKAEKSDYGVCATCHGDYQKVAARTEAKYKDSGQPNPHNQHDGALPCTECHKGHKAGVNYCAQCHSYVYKVP